MASTNPLATASPSPTPSPSIGHRAAGTVRTRGRGRPGGSPVLDRRRAARRDGRRPSRRRSHTVSPVRAPRLTRSPTTFAIARSSRAASTSTRGSDSGTSTSIARPPSGRLASARGTTSSRPTLARTRLRAPVWIRLMSRRLPTRLPRRSVSSSIVARNSAVSSGFHVTSSWRRLLTAALMRRQRRAQIVGHGWQDRRAQLVALCAVGGLVRLVAEIALTNRHRQCAANAVSTRRDSAGRPIASQHQDRAVGPSSMDSDAVLGRCGGEVPADASTTQSSPTDEGRTRPSSPNVCADAPRAWAAGPSSDSEPAGEPRERFGLGAPALRLRTASRAARSTRTLTTAANEHEHARSPNTFSGLGDRPRVDRLGEVPVDQQRRGDADDDRGPQSTQRGDGHDEREVQQHHAGEVTRVAERGQDQGERGRGRRQLPRNPAMRRFQVSPVGRAERGSRPTMPCRA